MRRSVLVAFVAALGLSSAALPGEALLGQAPAPGILIGTVIDDITGEPIQSARVTAGPSGGGGPGTGVLTDTAGRFELTDVTPGRLGIRARHPSYTDGSWGKRTHPFGMFQYFDLRDGERAEGFVIRLRKNVEISGRVVDRSGAPVVGAVVHVMRAERRGAGVVVAEGRTAEMGYGGYAVQSLPAGRYLLAVSSPTIPHQKLRATGTWPTAFAPGVPQPTEAGIITLEPGDRRAVDLRVNEGPTFAVRGRVSGVVTAGLELRLQPDGDVRTPLESARIRTDTEGRFEFAAVGPGRYRLQALRFPSTDSVIRFFGVGFTWESRLKPALQPPDEPTLWADVAVTITDRPIFDLDVPVRHGARFRGRVVFDGTAAPPSPDVMAETMMVAMPVARLAAETLPVFAIGANGQFTTVGLPPGRYAVNPMGFAPNGWYRKDFDRPFDLGRSDSDITLEFTDRPSSLKGTIRDASGAPRPDATVYLFPADRSLWQPEPWVPVGILTLVPDRYGQYDLIELTPREYYLAAVTDVQHDFPDPRVLESLIPRATRVRIDRPGPTTVDLTVK
jgi:protocatechuate 3,4-dioxygenase beta subunit